MRFLQLTTFLLSVALLASCSNDSPDNTTTEPSSVGITLKTRSTNTRATSAPEPNETIHNYWIAFVANNGNVAEIVKKELTSGVESDNFTHEISAGTYDIYAFANFNPYPDLQKGQSFPADINTKAFNTLPNYDHNDLVPMSGFIKGASISQNAKVAIEVVRLVAKMELQIENASSRDITINSVSLLPAKNDVVILMPDYSSLGNKPKLLPNANCTEFTRSVNKKIGIGNCDSDKFYLFESSAAAHPTGHYVLELELTRENSSKIEKLSALMKNLEFINRNDHILQPLQLIDFSLSIDANFYPPIGGYPAILEERHGDEYYFTFGSSGKFVILPTLTDSNGNIISPADYSVEIRTTVPDDNFYSKKPTMEATKEIIGELKTQGSTGNSLVELTITYTDNSDQATSKTYEFNRTLHIIRK